MSRQSNTPVTGYLLSVGVGGGHPQKVKQKRNDHMDILLKDIRFALRNLRKHPAFSAVAIITIALGIGTNTAIFSVVNAVLLRDLPYDEPDRLVRVWSTNIERGVEHGFMSPPDIADYQ